MTTLSKEAAKLHDIYHDYMMMRDVPEMTRKGWLEIASAALELAGMTAVTEQEAGVTYLHCCNMECLTVTMYKAGAGPPMVETSFKGRNMEALPRLAAILLHAAQTAAAWESEGK